MIIRSQNKKVICNFGVGCEIENLGENDVGEYLICMSYGQADYDIGRYTTDDEAMRVIGSIYAALKAGTQFYDMPESVNESKNLLLADLAPELSVRASNVLMRAGYTTLQEVAAAGDEKLMKARNMGRQTLNEIHDLISRYQEVLNEN